MARIQKHVWLAFSVQGQKLEASYTNPVLHKFYHLLNDFRIEKNGKDGMKVVVTSKDPAVLQQLDSTWVKGSIHLDMEVIGYREGEENIIGLDHDTEALILNELAKLKVDEGRYSKHVTIDVVEVTFSQTLREHPDVWPEVPLFRTQV